MWSLCGTNVSNDCVAEYGQVGVCVCHFCVGWQIFWSALGADLLDLHIVHLIIVIVVHVTLLFKVRQ